MLNVRAEFELEQNFVQEGKKRQYQHPIRLGALFICIRNMLILFFILYLKKISLRKDCPTMIVLNGSMGVLNSIESIGSYMPTRVQTTRLAPYA